MSTEDNIAIAAVRREFTDALAEVLAENAAVCPVRRGRVARAHAAIKRHPGYNEHEFCAAVEFAFERWETLQNAGSLGVGYRTPISRPSLPLYDDQKQP